MLYLSLKNNNSLNDSLEFGPNLNLKKSDIMLNFWRFNVALSGDI